MRMGLDFIPEVFLIYMSSDRKAVKLPGPNCAASKIPPVASSTRLLNVKYGCIPRTSLPIENEVGSFITFFKLVVASYTELPGILFIEVKEEESGIPTFMIKV